MRRLSNKRHCFPAGLISRSVRLYASFNLSCRNVEEMLAERGLNISHETVRRRILKFGSAIAAKLRRTSARPSGSWHLDELAIVIQRRRTWLWDVADKLRSYTSAFRARGLSAEHDFGLNANNRAENSRQPVRRQKRTLQSFKSTGSARRNASSTSILRSKALFNTSAISSNDRCTRSLEPYRSTLGNAQAWRLELGSEPAKL